MIDKKQHERMQDIKRSIEFVCGEIVVVRNDTINDETSKPFITWKKDCLILDGLIDSLHVVLDTLERMEK